MCLCLHQDCDCGFVRKWEKMPSQVIRGRHDGRNASERNVVLEEGFRVLERQVHVMQEELRNRVDLRRQVVSDDE